MEAIDAGTTTVVDHAHVNYSFHHSKAGLLILLPYPVCIVRAILTGLRQRSNSWANCLRN